MEKDQMKMAGIACLVICAICLFAAMERYNSNAANVNAMNAFRQSSPLRQITVTLGNTSVSGLPSGFQKMKPATPAATKYALLFALLSGVGGSVLLGKCKEDVGDSNGPQS